MKYRIQIDIQKPLAEVVELFDSFENLKKWQPELVSYEHLSGTPGEVGAKTNLIYKMGKREVEMVETILVRSLPQEFSATYEAKGVYNEVSNSFESIDGQTTKWTIDNEFRFSGFMKLMAFFMPGAFKKQTTKTLNQFKVFAENN